MSKLPQHFIACCLWRGRRSVLLRWCGDVFSVLWVTSHLHMGDSLGAAYGAKSDVTVALLDKMAMPRWQCRELRWHIRLLPVHQRIGCKIAVIISQQIRSTGIMADAYLTANLMHDYLPLPV